jgi:putative ABC transport system ATP-binding protein
MVSYKGGYTESNMGMIKVNNLKRVFQTGQVKVKALNGVTFNIDKKEFVAIMGPSGSGKSTLLHILGLIDKQSSGGYKINKLSLSELPEHEKSFYRLNKLGYVFQEYALIDELTSAENVYLSLIMEGMKKSEALKLAYDTLKRVGLEGKEDRLQNQLSGGERQRVAIARAIASKPSILFADEPCANLDSKTSEQILELFKKLNMESDLTIILVTHESWHTKFASRIIKMSDGLIVSDKKV